MRNQARVHNVRKPMAQVPRWLRPKLAADQVRDLSIVHNEQLDAIARGEATSDTLWSTYGGILTWHRVASKLGIGEPEMAEQLALLVRVVERYGRTGRIAFTGPEYQLAKDGVQAMDQLAALVDRVTAIEAAEWSERQVQATVNEQQRMKAMGQWPRQERAAA